MNLNVPFLPDERYIDFLNQHAAHISDCHFSLHAPDVADGRYKAWQLPMAELIKLLGRCRIPNTYLLLNARFQAADRYLSKAYLQDVTARLETMLEQGVLSGIVFGDLYFLNVLSDTAPLVASAIEAVPSINFMIDSAEKAMAILDGVAATHFKAPTRLPLDRALNRNPVKLTETAGVITQHHTNLRIELLVNEGCLHQCPFKLTHDSLIALLNTGVHVDTLAINRDLGCMRRLNQEPWCILASPFIRPQDVHHVEPVADLIKICGRTLGSEFLITTINAYLQGSYTGNLFDLLDACNWMASSVHLPNHKLPKDFWQQTTVCSKTCLSCGICRDMWNHTAQARPFEIPKI